MPSLLWNLVIGLFKIFSMLIVELVWILANWFVASFSVSWDKFHSMCNSVQIVHGAIWFETYLRAVIILARSKYVCAHIWLPQEPKHLFSLHCTLSFRQDKTRAELVKCNRKMKKKKNTSKNKKWQNLLQEWKRVNHWY